ncbi:uncharacterized protein EDB91DRAFT_609264 [Suillus paluster]|uniref:uncharacterized protein n=1 Tax=Suillus paluster TaxID=48578 RepID=UPI001B866D36|nr:uncharacterized protein EDB91DRAFT_609264 [Suillus paluster]KAG1751459.1 hypothetical protein EDB91DRAFT_609264 [Suillus paluster]
MHPALTTLDIICTISSHTEHGSLPALASTCRAFEHPALNVLWRDLQSVGPLVRCLPSNLFGIDEGCVVLQNPIDGKMWDTVFKYASRVHTITVTQSDCLKFLEPLSVLMLSCPLTPASLFPNLRKLTWRPGGTHIFAEILRTILVPSMSVLDVQICSASAALLSVLSSIGTLCPRLQNMTVTVRNATNDSLRKISPFITQPISQLHHLHTLSVWDLGTQGMEHVMQLRALQSLSLDLKISSAWHAKSPLQFPGFHDLESLALSTSTLQHASNFLSSLQVIRSKEIQIVFSEVARSSTSGSTALSHFFTVLERCDYDKLESLSLHGTLGPEYTLPGVFTSLHACRHLTQLVIERVCYISMSDEELCQLVSAWPKLKVLRIICYVTTNKTTVPTFHGLIGLLRLCPALNSLALVIDTTTKLSGIDLQCPGGGSRNKHIKSLDLGNSPINSPLNVALILSGLFPCLKQVNHAYGQYSMPQRKLVKEQWDLVNSILGGFRIVRRRGIKA